MAAIWRWVRSVPGWAWGVLGALASIAAVFLVGRRSGVLQERIDGLIRGVDAERKRDEVLDAAHAEAQAEAQKQIAIAVEEEQIEREQPVTKEQLDKLSEEFKAWPDD